MEEILSAHPVDDEEFWGNTNPTDVSIDIANSEEMMARSYITEFHTSKQEESVTTELLNKVLNTPEVCDTVQKCQLDPLNKSKSLNMLSKISNATHTNDINLISKENQDYDNQHDQKPMTCKHEADWGYHNRSNPQSTKSADCKLPTPKDEPCSSNTLGNRDTTEVMGKILDMVEQIISDMLSESSYLGAPTIVEDSNETTNENEMGD